MPGPYEDNSLTIGRTPLVRLARVAAGLPARVYGKLEGRNPTQSVKARAAAAMVGDAERRDLLGPGRTLLEVSSGNAAIALASTAAARGHPLVLVMPESVGPERIKLLALLGARLDLTPATLGMRGAVARAEALLAAHPDRYVWLRQFENPANPAIHEQTTGPEIWDELGGEVDVFVAGVGTGGTFTGVARYLKRTRGRSVLAVAVEPAESPVIAQARAGQVLRPGPHRILGLGAGFLPANLDLSLVDRVEAVHSDEAIVVARRLAREEGILAGISSGAATAAALRLAAEPGMSGRAVAVILPDAGERYLSGPLFEGLLDDLDVLAVGT